MQNFCCDLKSQKLVSIWETEMKEQDLSLFVRFIPPTIHASGKIESGNDYNNQTAVLILNICKRRK